MGFSQWGRCGAVCFVALACKTMAPAAKHPSAPPRAAEAESQRARSLATTNDDVPTASPAPTSAPSGAAPKSSDGRDPLRVPRVRLQAIVVESGDIDKEVWQRIVRQRAPELRDCYVPRLKERPQLQGQLHFRLQLASEGDVSSVVTVADTLGDVEAHACVKALMQSLVLPPPGAPAVIVVPLEFFPS